MIILKEAGLITLKEKTEIFYTILDIKDNPLNISLIETEIIQTARSIEDVDAIISTAYFVSEAAKRNPSSFLFEDPQNRAYAIGIIVRDEDLESKWAKQAMTALRSEKFRKEFETVYGGKYTMFP